MKRIVKKMILAVKVMLIIFVLGSFLPYKYNNEKAVAFATMHCNKKSKCMCALYVMEALQQGGCYPCGIYPAYAYSERLISLGFKEISTKDYIPSKGDIVVLGQNSKSVFGHIAIYNGTKWISDFEQKSIYPSTTYERESKMKIFRQSNGWHIANIWFSPKKLIEYVKTFVDGFHRIKF